MKMYYLLSLIIVFFSFGCKQNVEPITPIDDNNLLIGYWVNPVYSTTGNEVSLIRANEFNQEYGFKFNSNFEFKERKNAGWCGTPPISYGNFDGKFDLKKSLINIDVAYWGGKAKYEWEIIKLDVNKLTIKKIKEDYIE